MTKRNNQGKLFPKEFTSINNFKYKDQLLITNKLLYNWQTKIYNFQSSLFKDENLSVRQESFFQENDSYVNEIYNLNPLTLSPLAISFWRWPKTPHKGPAIYFVMDRPSQFDSPLLLYIGETISAEKRWKGNHDCKIYLSAYSEALAMVNMHHQLSIRFWNDAPKKTQERRKIEQLLIQKWQPPFNKETRARWQTPFTTDI